MVVEYCIASLYLGVGLFVALSLLFQTVALKFSGVSASQYLLAQLAFGVAYLLSLPLLYRAFSGVCL